MVKILTFGGTNFIGRNLIDGLLTLDKYEITLFNRGITNPDLFPGIRKIKGDRNTSDVNLISKENWDYIIDLSCYYPDSLLNVINSLKNDVQRYIFISTCSVYDHKLNKTVLRKEDSPIHNCNDKERTDSSIKTYGKRKAECERILQKSGLRYTIFRPALVYGEFDNTDRFYYWLYQVKRGKELLIPDNGKNLFSVTYVKDLIQVIINSINSESKSNIYNVTTYLKLSISKIIEMSFKLLNSYPKLYNANSEFLSNNKIAQWTDLPLWLDSDYFTYDNAKIISDLNMKITDFEISLRNTINYYDKQNWKNPKSGISDYINRKLINQLKISYET